MCRRKPGFQLCAPLNLEGASSTGQTIQTELPKRGNDVTTNEIKEVLLWCVGINYAALLVWFGVFVYAHDWMYRMHTRWFKLSVETFDTVHYAGISTYKIGIILLNLVPLVALYLSS
jgi:Family of unknown function (DUF6868)